MLSFLGYIQSSHISYISSIHHILQKWQWENTHKCIPSLILYVIIQTQKCRGYSSYKWNSFLCVEFIIQNAVLTSGNYVQVRLTGKTDFHIVIFNRVNVRDSFSLLRKVLFQNFYSQRQLRNETTSRKGFQMEANLAPVRPESDKKALILTQNILWLQRFNF